MNNIVVTEKNSITITTQSGSRYELRQKDGEWFFQKGLTAGKIIEFKEEIQVGAPLHISFYREGIYGTYHKDAGLLRTSPITSIVIK